MNFLDWSTVAGLVTIAIFLWRLTHTLNRDMHKMGEKMSDLGLPCTLKKYWTMGSHLPY